MSSMNARAPTDLHSRTSNNSISYDDDEAPDDEQSHHRSIKSSSSVNSNNSQSLGNGNSQGNNNNNSQQRGMSADVNDIDLVGKKRKVKDRPWQKTKAYDSILTSEEDVNVIGVPSYVSPSKAAAGEEDDDNYDDDIIITSPSENDDNVSYDDVLSSRWDNQKSSPKEAEAATVNAVGLAASRLADQLDPDDSFVDHANVAREIDQISTPQKAADHNRVRMEALNLLNLANNKDSVGGYIVKGKSSGQNQVKSTSSKKNRVQNALQGLGGIGSEKRKNYERFTTDKMEYDDVDGMEDVTIEDMEYGQNPSPKKNNGTWGSRYSVDHHMAAMHGGLSRKEVLSNMDRDHYNNLNKQNQNTSATTMFKTSPHENDDRWNVASGARSTPTSQSRMFNTWIATVKESSTMVLEKMSSLTSRSNNGNNPHVTLGSHRQADHSSSPKGIFTGLAVTRFLDKLSPRSKSAAMREFTETDDVNFSAQDDYIYDRRLKRRRMLSLLVFILVAIAAILGVVVTVSNRDSNGRVGAIYGDVGETVKFYVTNDVPHNMADEVKLARDLANLHPRNGDFLVHLGDVGDASIDMCTMNVYKDAADLLKQSPIPVFVLPGDEDWNNCPDPRTAFGYWMEELNRFEENFDKAENTNFPSVKRQMARSENFSFLHKGVLFIAFHLVDGTVQSESEWSLRIAEDVAWMDEEFNDHGVEEYRAIVIMAHAAPTSKIGDFVWPLKDTLMKLKKPVLYLHANDGEGMLSYKPYPDELPTFNVVRMEKGYKAPPTQITVEFGFSPFKFRG